MQVRNVRSSDCQQVLAVINDWRGGRNMADMLPTLFFDHFQNTSFIVEEDGQMVAFLIGFVSQSQAEESYIHFIGVHPEFRKHGLAHRLYNLFLEKVRSLGCSKVRCVTSPLNEGSIQFHTRIGFEIESVAKDYDGRGNTRVLFVKMI